MKASDAAKRKYREAAIELRELVGMLEQYGVDIPDGKDEVPPWVFFRLGEVMGRALKLVGEMHPDNWCTP